MVAGPVFWRSSGRLADGREIIYFDEAPGFRRAAVPDGRDLSPGRDLLPSQWSATDGTETSGHNGLRLDPLLGEWVMYGAQRQDRTYRPAAAQCPLCPSRPDYRTEIPAPDYDVVVFQNRFPALARPGRCEVICFTADHEASFASLSQDRVLTVVEAWADRTVELGGQPGVEHVYCFENRGEEIGVTMQHPHGQVYAFPFVPPRIARLVSQAHAHRLRTGRNLFDDVVGAELSDGRRLIARNEHWLAFVPQAARWPFEVMIFPSVRLADLPAVDPAARTAFCSVYLDVLRRLDALFGAPMPYIAAWQQAPVSAAADRAEFGLHLHVMAILRAPGKVKYQAGTESGAGAWSNDVLPETAARMLRDAEATGGWPDVRG